MRHSLLSKLIFSNFFYYSYILIVEGLDRQPIGDVYSKNKEYDLFFILVLSMLFT